MLDVCLMFLSTIKKEEFFTVPVLNSGIGNNEWKSTVVENYFAQILSHTHFAGKIFLFCSSQFIMFNFLLFLFCIALLVLNLATADSNFATADKDDDNKKRSTKATTVKPSKFPTLKQTRTPTKSKNPSFRVWNLLDNYSECLNYLITNR
jgi:hypothetical protein